MLKEFRDFVLRGNVIDLAVAVVIGAAFGAVVTSAVENLFTPLIAAIVGEPLPGMPYERRLACLKAHGIGVWDAIVACERPGSLDAAIRAATRAETARVHRAAPKVAIVCFNGRTAARAAPVWREAGYATLVLPSTSPAYTRPFAEKLAAWRALADHLPARPRGPGPA